MSGTIKTIYFGIKDTGMLAEFENLIAEENNNRKKRKIKFSTKVLQLIRDYCEGNRHKLEGKQLAEIETPTESTQV